MSNPTDALSRAAATLGEIMSALNTRQLLAKDRPRTEPLRLALEAKLRTDEQLLNLAADAFEAAVLALAEAGHVGVTVMSCDGGLGSAEAERYMESERRQE